MEENPRRQIAIIQNDPFSDKQLHFLKHYKIIHQTNNTVLIETPDLTDEINYLFPTALVYPIENTKL